MVIQIVDTTEDMTQLVGLKQADSALRASEAKLSGIISIAADAIITIDDDQRITIYNEAAQQIFGWTPGEIIGKPLDLLIPERFRETHRKHVRVFGSEPVKARRMGERRTIFGLRKNGEEFPAEAAISKFALDGGRLLTVVLRDVTERLRIEQENARLYEEAQRAIQARDDVLAIVAHDLRNPIAAIVMAAEALRPRSGQPERRSTKSANTIRRAARRLKRLVQDLLAVGCIEARQFAIARGRVLPAELLAEMLEAERELVSSASLELHLDLPEDLPDVPGDHERLMQVFENLIANAIKFTEPGGRVTAGARACGGDVLFWVADTGVGMPADALPHVFDRFWQAKRDGRTGAGLGLTIVKGIVDAHGGRVWVESSVDRGSTFFFTIPTTSPRSPWGAPEESRRA